MRLPDNLDAPSPQFNCFNTNCPSNTTTFGQVTSQGRSPAGAEGRTSRGSPRGYENYGSQNRAYLRALQHQDDRGRARGFD